MKKVLVVLVVLPVALTGVFAETGDAGNGSLTVYGKITAGDLDFKVVQEQASDNQIDLVGNESVQPSGTGVRVGRWTFSADTQAPETSFQIGYTTSPLVSATIADASYAFEVLEIPSDSIVGYSNKVISFVDSTSRDITQGLAVRLLQAIPAGAKPANDFEGTIFVTLTKN